MPKLNYKACGFPANLGQRLRGSHSLDVTWDELIRVAITVGRKNWAKVFQHGYHSKLEIIYRLAILMANLKDSDQNELTKTDAYKGLDPSEKSAISYFLGLSFANWAAQKFLGIRWLIHLDHFRDAPIELKGNSRPDLVGQGNSGRWSVFEAKGRTNEIDQNVIQKAKQQTLMLKKIAGCDPEIRVASIVHFSNDKFKLHLEVPDPNESHPDAVDLEIPGGEDRLLQYYYQPFLSLVDSMPIDKEKIEDRNIIVARLNGVDLEVGLDIRVKEILTSEGPFRSRLIKSLPLSELADSDTASFIGPEALLHKNL